jgi:hypothetical protein
MNGSTSSWTLLQQQQQLAEQQRRRLHAEQLWPSPVQQMHQVPVPQRASCCSRGWSCSKRLAASAVLSQLRAKAAAVPLAAVRRTGTAKC